MDPDADNDGVGCLSVTERLKAIEEANRKTREDAGFLCFPSNPVVRRKLKARRVNNETYLYAYAPIYIHKNNTHSLI